MYIIRTCKISRKKYQSLCPELKYEQQLWLYQLRTNSVYDNITYYLTNQVIVKSAKCPSYKPSNRPYENMTYLCLPYNIIVKSVTCLGYHVNRTQEQGRNIHSLQYYAVTSGLESNTAKRSVAISVNDKSSPPRQLLLIVVRKNRTNNFYVSPFIIGV